MIYKKNTIRWQKIRVLILGNKGQENSYIKLTMILDTILNIKY